MDNLLNELKELTTTCVSDALNGLNNLDPAIKPLTNDMKAAGKAFTVKVRAADNKLVLQAIRDANPGDVLVVDAKGYLNNASAGDFVIGLAKTLGLSGVIIDGVVRDVAGIRALNFPVFCKGVTTAASDKHGSGQVNVPISCGDTVINPGDYILGDEDGVVCIPLDQAEDIIGKAKAKLVKDVERERTVLSSREAAIEYINKQLAD
ncbi:RraA family protein [Robertmurraya massiliosenegalensis]|uniref:RraA family protein n=1 Tax=Robertmurraya TaxID=2837507 RepID=UPI0039A68712